jgi:hypothetical protein
MSTEWERVATELASHPNFRWLDGMRGCDPYDSSPSPFRVCDEDETPLYCDDGQLKYLWEHDSSVTVVPCADSMFPDLLDHATQGVLWMMLVEACAALSISKGVFTPKVLGKSVLMVHNLGLVESVSFIESCLGVSIAKALLYLWSR